MEGKQTNKQNEITIYNYVDMEGIRNYLILYPHLLAIIEFLLLHINDYVKEHQPTDISQSSHIWFDTYLRVCQQYKM